MCVNIINGETNNHTIQEKEQPKNKRIFAMDNSAVIVGKSNRWFKVGSVKRKLAKYGRNVLRNSGIWCDITGLRKTKKYRLAE